MSAGHADALGDVLGVEQGFGHRAHVHLAWRFLQHDEEIAAQDKMRAAVRQVAAAHGTPDKYHETLTLAWIHLVAAHVRADPGADFETFIARNAGLLDRSLPSRHFSSDVLQSAEARRAFVPPDLAPLP